MRTNPELIVASGPEVALQAVVGASLSIPIVIQAINYDPIERGYVTSLSRPGGNITGVFYRQPELAAAHSAGLPLVSTEPTHGGQLC